MGAARKFEEAGNSSSDAQDIAEAFEQAAQCYKMCKDAPSSYRCYQRAVENCRRGRRPAKVALLAEAMIEVAPDQIAAMRNAIECFDHAEDRRASQMKERLANNLAEKQDYASAARFFAERADELAQDQAFIRSAGKNYLLSLCCNQLSDQRANTNAEWFEGTQEHRTFLNWQEFRNGESETFESTLDLPSWLLKIEPDDRLA